MHKSAGPESLTAGKGLLQIPMGSLRNMVPALDDFFASTGLPLPGNDALAGDFFAGLDPEIYHDIGVEPNRISEVFVSYVEGMLALEQKPRFELSSLTILGGSDKSGKREDLELELKPGQIICLVGPTGSGKSRLLADIEWMARGDTPTGRRILINGQPPEISWRHSQEHRLFAQLSQNMNFVMDVNVRDFIRLHAESRLVEDVAERVELVIGKANELAGEAFSPETLLTDLSGGQSRALMIADIALLSRSPVVLIDEIENAGIDRGSALDLLVGEEKIVLIATHDPILALMGERRLILQNGGIKEIVESSVLEKRNLAKIDQLDKILLQFRDRIRKGERLEFDIDSLINPLTNKTAASRRMPGSLPPAKQASISKCD